MLGTVVKCRFSISTQKISSKFRSILLHPPLNKLMSRMATGDMQYIIEPLLGTLMKRDP